ncbi:hypothetical protein Pint_15840 [Pistacia integerrima]|uniref:Uncharacterized protein n=1 Tax=Pistacia integerrima TaxID=434235 RepID=A0ACC0ZC91_9ROSI|nr:hypothetical protein Pint_15840 [Pistacia integerrima]
MGDDDKKDVGTSGLDKKTQNLYSLNPNDNPGNIITQVQLKGENYDEWAWAVRTVLQAKKKYGFIDGTVKQSEDNSLELEDWWTVNSMLVSWVLNTIKPTLRPTISYMENVKDLWEDIRKREEERVHQFLMGLDEEGYGTVHSNILSTEPLPNLNRAYAMVIQQERLIGYPEWWGNRPRTSVTRRGGGRKRGTGSSRNEPGISQANVTQASVELPNGEETMALKEGTVFLGEALILRHDQTSRKLIGVGERCEGVYFFKGVASAHACKTKGVGSSELWHMRIGHPSFKVLEMIPEVGSLEVDADEQHVQDAKEDGEANHDREEAPTVDTSEVEGNIVEENENVEEPLGRGQRVKQPSVRLRDYVTNTIKVNPSTCSSLQSNSSGLSPIEATWEYYNIVKEHVPEIAFTGKDHS